MRCYSRLSLQAPGRREGTFAFRRSVISQRLVRDERGTIAVMFGAAASFLLLAAGGAVDVGRIYGANQRLQSALDAAVIAAARGILIENLTAPDSIQANVRTMLVENLKVAMSVPITLDVSVEERAVEALASVQLDTPILALAGIRSMKTNVRSRASIAETNLEVSLVVDTTGSMKINGHVGNVTSALSDLINDLEPLAPKIAMVPFSEMVNIGPAYQSSWIDLDGRSPTHGVMFDETSGPVIHHNLFSSMGIEWGNCVEMRAQPYDVTDDPPVSSNPSTLFVPFFGPAVLPFANYLKAGYQNIRGVGVVRDRTRYIPSNRASITDPGHPGDFYTPNANCNRNPIIPLTTDYGQIRSRIASLDFDGGTNIPSGLSWGWHVLSPGEPFAQGAAYGTLDTRKVLVLLTDGQNDMKVEANGFGMFYDRRMGQSGTSWIAMTPLVDARMDLLCKNIKASGVGIYIISYALGDTAETAKQKARMDKCASSPESHFDAENPAELRRALVNIVRSVTPITLER